MYLLSSVRAKNSRSRIPVPVANQKSQFKKTSSLNSTERSLFDKKPASRIQTSNVNKTANLHFQKELVKKCSSQPEKSQKNLNDRTIRGSKFQSNTQLSLKANIKSNDNKNLKTNKNCVNKKEALATLKSNAKSNVNEKTEVKSACNIKPSDNQEEKSPILKFNVISDDALDKLHTPTVISTKENKISCKQDCFSAQKGIKFEANEFYRNMILSERELSPSICRLMPNLRASSVQAQRPSAYQKFEIPPDPFKEARKAIENACLSVRRGKKLSVKENKMPLTPYKDRGSFYTPCADPKQEVMKSLEEFKLKQLQKNVSRSTKKVTFNLKIEECAPKNVCDIGPKEFKNAESRLTQINEKSEENTPNSPHSERTEAFSLKENQGNSLTSELEDSYMTMKKCESSTIKVTANSIPTSLTMDVTPEKLLPIQCRETLLQSIRKTDSLTSSPTFIFDNKQVMCETASVCQRAINMSTLEHKNVNSINIKSAKVYTPRPISLVSKSKLTDSSSPEFLVKGKSSILTELAPICTPLVLKSIAKNNMFSPEVDLSPVRLKLDFTEVEKDTPKRTTSKTQTVVTLENIATIQKELDHLADQECCILLLNENIPIICGRYLKNPVALTLSEGDDMHFIPIQL